MSEEKVCRCPRCQRLATYGRRCACGQQTDEQVTTEETA